MANPNAAAAAPKDNSAAAAAAAGPAKKAPVSSGATLEAADVKQILTDARPPLVALLANEIWAREAGVRFNTWEVVVPAGTPFENVMLPAFWANVSRRMKMGDKVLVLPRDGQWYAELLVWDAGQNWAHVDGGCARRPTFGAAPGVDSEFEVVSDPVDGHIVKRKASGAVLKKNFPNAEDARRWILDHQKALRT